METSVSPLEGFVRDYVDVTGGVWEEIEPQVYDVLLPQEAGGGDVPLRLAFDPEALPEHPTAQLASFGTPLINRMLTDAVARGRYARFWFIGLNLAPHDLAGRIRRGLTLPADFRLGVEHIRPMLFPQAVFWFQATFVSDQKEQEILPVAVDLHSGRQVRHLERLLDPARLTDTPVGFLPESRRLSLAAGYPLAQGRVLRTLAALANTLGREIGEHVERQIARVQRYYADLCAELEEQRARAESRAEDLAKFAGRREALEREERARIADLRHKGSMRVELRLLQVLVVNQPKIRVRTRLTFGPKSGTGTLELVWDPLTEALEPVPCPECQRPTLAWDQDRMGQLVCPACKATATPSRKPR